MAGRHGRQTQREKICPRCVHRRPDDEIFCQAYLEDGSVCGWDLTDVPIDLPPPAPPLPAPEPALLCVNGHSLNPGDYICGVCGADPAAPTDPEPPRPSVVSTIGGWELLSRLPNPGTTNCFRVRGVDGIQGILTLYPEGLAFDPEVEAAVDALTPAATRRVLGRGEHDCRQFEVVESADGRTLDDITVSAVDSERFRKIVRAIGAAVNAISRAGVRHRDLRPQAILPGPEPETFTLSRFGFAVRSSHDLDTAAPAELSRYTAPEMLAGAVSPASDWWSLGVILLEKLTRGAPFEGISDQAFLMNVVANGADIPADLTDDARLLLRGLLARDRTARWNWEDIDAWAKGEPRSAPEEGKHSDDAEAGSIELGGRTFRTPSKYALAAGRAENWVEARDQLARGALTTWLEEFPTGDRVCSAVRNLMRREGLDDDTRLSVGLKILNPDMPLVRAGEIVTPAWLLQHPMEGYELISGPAPALLEQLNFEPWLVQLNKREAEVRRRATASEIALNEDVLRINLLCTSRRRLDDSWEIQRREAPDSDHKGLASLMDRPQLAEADVLILASAGRGQFRPLQEVLQEALELARKERLRSFDETASAALLRQTRREVMRQVGERVENFARCGLDRIDEWVDQFRLERRVSLARAAVILSVPPERWKLPPGQEYVSQLLGFFEKRINVSVSRGSLARMTITKTSPRLDLTELGTEGQPADRLLDHLLERSDVTIDLDPWAFASNPDLEHRLRTLVSRAELLRRETGIDGLYMGFPFLLAQPRGESVKPRIAPVFLWPIRIGSEVGQRSRFSLSFDRDREEIRINPALQNLFSREELTQWEAARDNILAGAVGVTAVMDELSHLVSKIRHASLTKLAGPEVKIKAGSPELSAAAVLFHVTFVGQAIVEDIRQLRSIPPAGTNLESLLRVQDTVPTHSPPPVLGDDIDRYATAESDPTQDRAVVMAGTGPGLVIEGPPGTGKSQTIVNMVADAIGRKKSILIICQKQAALDVVRKRLQREGLGDRLVMVTDLTKDRRPIIQTVREQVEAVLANGAPDVSWKRERAAVLDRIRSLEDRLNTHQEVFHSRDEVSGRTYRELISELVSLEDAGVIGDCLELRELLGVIKAEQAHEIGETCASLSRLWLPAEYEGSALANLRAFGWDQATLNRFQKDLDTFRDAERRRPVTPHSSGMIEFQDPEPARRWVEDARGQLWDLTDVQSEELAHFVDFFLPSKPVAATGAEFIRKLSHLQEELRALARQPEEIGLLQIIVRHSDVDLDRWIGVATSATRAVSVFGRLSIARCVKRQRLRALLRATCASVDDQVMCAYLAAAKTEKRLRSARAQLQAIYVALGDKRVNLGRAAASDLMAHADWLTAILARVEGQAFFIASSPAPARTLAAVKSRQTKALGSLFEDINAAIARSDARNASRRALVQMERWCEPAWIKGCEAHIAKNQSTSLALDPIAGALGTLAPYQQYRVRANDLPPDTVAVLAALRQLAGQLRLVDLGALAETVRRALRREACLGWKARLEKSHPLLLLDQPDIDELVRSLAEAETELRQINKRAITANIDHRRLGTRSKWEDITRLAGPRARRLREFMDLGWDIGLKEVRPVWLMGPDVASRMIPLRPVFDMIVYDEASQMPVEFALPSLYRGKSVIISGDDQQLPPTSFFANRVDVEEEEAPELDEVEDISEEERQTLTETWNRREIKDCPNLLELSKAVLSKIMLQVHYRSAYRELISFSNNAFYDGELNVPVRHPLAEVNRIRPLEVVRVNGLYEHRTNADEAREVVNLLAAIWCTEHPPSVGVVTFNRDQADLIEQKLEERAEDNAEFRAAYRRELARTEHGEDMRFFVKNVENVQGDERDHIIFSTTFGKNSSGKFRRNFGVLGQSGGERRLNVAVTRARRKITVLTSMPVDEIATALGSGAKPQLPRDYLQLYLAYAAAVSGCDHQSGGVLLGQVLRNGVELDRISTAVETDGFARSVRAYLISLGVTPEPANDGSAFGIDFAIRHPNRGTYGIGIECDGPRHAILKRARAREIWRRSEMQKSIPVIHRISMRGWYHERSAEQLRLRTAIAQALR